MKRNIKDILHSADSSTVERIADRGNAAESETAERIFNKCLTRMDNDSEQTEMYTAETVRRAPRFAGTFIAAASLFVVLGAVGLALKFKSPAPKPVDNTPIIAATGTTSVSPNGENSIVDTTETNAVGRSADSTKAPETAVTTVTAKNELRKSTVPAIGGFITTNTTANTAKTTAKTTKSSSKTTAAKTTTKTVTTAKANEKRMTLAEIEEWEQAHVPAEMMRERAILNGVIRADSPRVTLAQIKQFIAESSNFDEIYKKIRNVQPYPDVNGGSGVTLIEYWVNVTRSDYVLLCPENMSIYVMDENSKRAEELYTEPRVTTPPVTNKPEYAGEITLDDVLKLAKNSQNLQMSDFRKYCSSPDYYDDSDMTFIISDRENCYLVVNANNDGSIAVCSLVDNVGHHSIDIRITKYEEVLNSINEWSADPNNTVKNRESAMSIGSYFLSELKKGRYSINTQTNLDSSPDSPFTYVCFVNEHIALVSTDERLTDAYGYFISDGNVSFSQGEYISVPNKGFDGDYVYLQWADDYIAFFNTST